MSEGVTLRFLAHSPLASLLSQKLEGLYKGTVGFRVIY